ncbi:MAG TPA: thioredoxin domain-containing protein [Terriglobales bacterium]|nr:thioredoxin domain-containing protein [Terriglobales bacterium]
MTPSLNALSRASSSYLRSAMHQPIQWHEWGEEAFAAAKRDNKPILLDIGAVWCHWCHVMDRESYDDPEVAKIVNENYIAVKVDRDERPDIDARYQVAVSSLSGQGGWPLTGFLTPDGKPFYGGTYFPPQDQYGRPSFKRVLLSIAQAYREKNGDVVEQANMVTNAISQAESFSGRSGEVSPKIVEAIVESAVKMFDERNGGFGNAPKFPHPSTLDLMIDYQARTDSDAVRDVIVTTLEKMARGGVYDQLAGGFHRYSVDERWVVPHFEKMSYDNSELLKNYVHAWQSTGNEFFAEVARDMIRWMDEWLSDREHGGFYASQDADYSMDDDGDYFTWTVDEAKAVLSREEMPVAALHYDLNEVGEMHHNPAKNVLYVRASVEEIERRLSLPEARVRELLATAKKKLYAARLLRPTPYVDKTLYVGWNAMCISAYLKAARVLAIPEALRFALRSLDRILAEGWSGGTGRTSNSTATASDKSVRPATTPALAHVIAYSDPVAEPRKAPGVLDDYAFTVIACVDAYEATADLSYFNFARSIADSMVELFFDSDSGGFFDTARAEPGSSEPAALGILGTRRKPFQDSPTPAGNPAAAIALLRLHAYTNEPSYREKAERTLGVFATGAEKYGMFAATYALAVGHATQPHTQVVVVGQDEIADRLVQSALGGLSFNKAVVRISPEAAISENLPPALAETIPTVPALREGRSFAVVCSGFSCQAPAFDADVLSRQLHATSRPAA